ncbi:AT-hook motif nuclear-localized protein 28-like [Canna indica]|uniref:AT-hook motif nuclear-localized protein 28-like n=1 Tax=Canna indica TaxID=4628 RepID=A0AAQ3Q8K9_9LILI|nr:AT-hook motif nuclear-localized protein 28-like [Canna indica]
MKGEPIHHYYLQHRPHQQMSHSDEADSSRSSSEHKNHLNTPNEDKDPTGGDGSTIEVVKRRRGRPPGSKNKPKPPVVITKEAESSAEIHPHVLEIPAGHDVVDSLAGFSRRRNLGVCVLSGTGSVANVILRQPQFGGPPPSSRAPTTIFFHGSFEILTISATLLPPAMLPLSPAAPTGLSISLAGPQGQIVGGTVAGPLVAVATVTVVAATFSNPTFHRLPAEDEVPVTVSASSSGGVDLEHEHEQRIFSQQRKHRQRPPMTTAETPTAAAESFGAVSIYTGHVPSDIIWSPIARPPPPPPY